MIPNAPAPRPASLGLDRRKFLQTLSTAGLGLALASPGSLWAQTPVPNSAAKTYSANDTLNIALVGIGAQGRVLIDALLKVTGIRIVAICDIWEYSLTYGQRYLKRAGQEVRAYADHQEMLAQEKDLDAVIVANIDSFHAPVTNDCLRAGKHVYCEKMMSNTVEGARSMVKTMQETGKLLQIGHQRRSNPRYQVARTRLLQEAKLLGQITGANAQWNRAVSADLGWPNGKALPADILAKYGFDNMNQFRNWRWFKKHGGGPLSDLGAHQIDIFSWFLDATPATVFASGGTDFYKTHEWFDNAMVIYEFALPQGTARAFYQVQTTTSAGGGYWEQFMGSEGTLKMSENPKYTTLYREAAAPPWDEYVKRNLLVGQTAAPAVAEAKVDARETAALASYGIPVVLNKAIHQPHLENFFNAIRGQGKLNCPADEAFRSEMAVYKAIESVEKRQLLTLKPEDFIA